MTAIEILVTLLPHYTAAWGYEYYDTRNHMNSHYCALLQPRGATNTTTAPIRTTGQTTTAAWGYEYYDPR